MPLMNKTVNIDEKLHLAVKKRALETGETLQQFVEAAVKTRLAMMPVGKPARRKGAK